MQFPPSSLDFVQDIGQAGRVQPQYPENYSYVIYYSIKNFLYIFENLCNPDETYIDNLFLQEVMKDFFDMATLLVLAPNYYYVATKLVFGNTNVQNIPALHYNCGIYPYFQNEWILPSLWQTGAEEVIFNVFYPDRDDDNIADDIGP